MFGELLAVAVLLISFLSCQDLSNADYLEDDFQLDSRQARFFPFFGVVRFSNSECSANNNLNGTCYTRRECVKYGGSSCGSCANSLGVCCVFQKTCGSSTSVNNTYFVNPNFPSKYQGGDRCTITVYPCSSDICQLRIDFLDFSLAQNNGTGTCDYDYMIISGATTKLFPICGENANQHVYVNFNGINPITISIDTNAAYDFGRQWNLRIQQIECDAPWRAPSGCLQYYTSASGSLMSFNYGPDVNLREPRGTRQLIGATYTACIRMALGYCSVEWSQANANSFTVSGDTSDWAPELLGTWYLAMSGMECTQNFVIVKNPNINDTDRFCGGAFVTKSSNLYPFSLSVVTNGEGLIPVLNKGFALNWKQQACDVSLRRK